MITKINDEKNKIVKYFWRGVYITLITLGIWIHKVDLWVYNKVDYKYFVKENENNLIDISRQPFRRARRAW